MPMPYELVSFGDVEALADRIRGCRAVVDASHGFDGEMTRQGALAAAKLGLPFVTLRRPAWALEGPRWRRARDVEAAVASLGTGSRVFAATGWASLDAFAGFRGERVYLRQTTPHDRAAPFDFVELVFGDPPFTRESEVTLFRDLRITTLICRNLGGRPSRPKLDAATVLGLDIVLIDRPPVPEGINVLSEVDAVLGWVDGL
jgi:precorrin-6A/cobalt-precorrin-6A reductase